jgi:hypothetical protein
MLRLHHENKPWITILPAFVALLAGPNIPWSSEVIGGLTLVVTMTVTVVATMMATMMVTMVVTVMVTVVVGKVVGKVAGKVVGKVAGKVAGKVVGKVAALVVTVVVTVVVTKGVTMTVTTANSLPSKRLRFRRGFLWLGPHNSSTQGEADGTIRRNGGWLCH